ncbi:MAG: hypothetical protein OIN87_02580 [Candidatus Methanoperedens sp.]|nr:hypothetical protein [Candidatus Methanoperedens sp.]
MDSRRVVLLLVFILVIPISGCIDEDSEQVPVVKTTAPVPVQTTVKAFPLPDHQTVYVIIKGTEFNPPEYEIVKGTAVKWTNQDSGLYVVNVNGSKSPPLNKKDSWNYTFNEIGIFEYSCDLHPSMPHGRITVI